MNETTHYKLNQWVEDDRIMRTDFNADNQKLDAALAAQAAALAAETEARVATLEAAVAQLRSENLVKVLADVTTTQAVTQVNLNVADIDFTQYSKIDLLLELAESSGQVNLRVNNETQYSAANGGGITQYLVNGANSYTLSYALLFSPPIANTPVFAISFGGQFSGAKANSTTWDQLNTFNFISYYSIQPGSRILLTGVKK